MIANARAKMRGQYLFSNKVVNEVEANILVYFESHAKWRENLLCLINIPSIVMI